jgi:hypothetical protein
MNHHYNREQKNMEEIEDEGKIEDILQHVNDLQEVERKFEGIENPRKKRKILENMPDVYHVKEHDGLHEGFRRAMYHMDEYKDLHERRVSNDQKKD